MHRQRHVLAFNAQRRLSVRAQHAPAALAVLRGEVDASPDPPACRRHDAQTALEDGRNHSDVGAVPQEAAVLELVVRGEPGPLPMAITGPDLKQLAVVAPGGLNVTPDLPKNVVRRLEERKVGLELRILGVGVVSDIFLYRLRDFDVAEHRHKVELLLQQF